MEPNQNKTNQNPQPVQTPGIPVQQAAAQAPPPVAPNQNVPQQSPPLNPNPSAPSQNPPKKGGNKIILFSVIGVLLIILVSLLYLFSSKFIGSNRQAEVTPIPQKITKPSPVSQIETAQTDNTDLGNPETDLKSIEQDLIQL